MKDKYFGPMLYKIGTIFQNFTFYLFISYLYVCACVQMNTCGYVYVCMLIMYMCRCLCMCVCMYVIVCVYMSKGSCSLFLPCAFWEHTHVSDWAITVPCWAISSANQINSIIIFALSEALSRWWEQINFFMKLSF